MLWQRCVPFSAQVGDDGVAYEVNAGDTEVVSLTGSELFNCGSNVEGRTVIKSSGEL